MVDVIEPTWAEVNGWMFLLIVAIGFIVYAMIRAKKEEERESRRIRGWDD